MYFPIGIVSRCNVQENILQECLIIMAIVFMNTMKRQPNG